MRRLPCVMTFERGTLLVVGADEDGLLLLVEEEGRSGNGARGADAEFLFEHNIQRSGCFESLTGDLYSI